MGRRFMTVVMSRKTEVIKEEINMDDLAEKIEETTPSEVPNEDKMAMLKAKLAEAEAGKLVSIKKEEKKPEPKRSIEYGVIGLGQGGSRLAKCFYQRGYDAIFLNTASVDLDAIDVPSSNKLLLRHAALEGAARDLSIGRASAEAYSEQILDLINNQLSNSQLLIIATSLGGGSGSGSCSYVCNLASQTGKPIVVLCVLPMQSEDNQSKSNALETLSELSKLVQSDKISNIILVDNARIEAIYKDVSQMDFFNVANEAIIEPLHTFNVMSSTQSPVKAIDKMEFGKLISDSGLSVMGEMKVYNYKEDTALAEAVISNLNSNLLSSGFDLKQSRYVGVLFLANKKVWDKIPASSINYSNSIISDMCDHPKGIFRGIYTTDSDEDCVQVYSFFSGLSFPEERINQLKEEVKQHSNQTKEKDVKRNLALNVDTGSTGTVSDVQKIKDKIAASKSAFSKFSSPVVDRRKT